MFSAQLFPFNGLAVLKKLKELLGVYGKFTIIVTGIPFDISAVVKQAVFNLLFKCNFFGFDCHY